MFLFRKQTPRFETTHLSRFTQIIKKGKNGRKRIHLLVVSYFLYGLSRTDISTALKVARSSVNRCGSLLT